MEDSAKPGPSSQIEKTEMITELEKKKKVRGGHCTHGMKLLGTAKDLIGSFDGTERDNLVQVRLALTNKLETLKRLDETILDLVSAEENGEEMIAPEIKDSEKIKAEIRGVILSIEEKLKGDLPITPPACQAVPTQSMPPKNEKAKARLPKLEVKKFGGRIHEWQEFWDSFESAIHSND